MNIIKRSNTRRRRIACIGMYDGLHLGHRFLIDYVEAEGKRRGLATAVVTFADHPLKVVAPLRAPRLLTSLDERIGLLEAEGVEDCIILPFTERLRRLSARDFLMRLKQRYGVDTLVVGFNTRFGRDCTDGIDEYRRIGAEIGMEILAAPEYKGKGAPVSSSIIRRYLASGDLRKATEALGRPYRLEGRVTSGRGIGRRIGFPTANIVPLSEDSVIPAPGVYAVIVTTPDGVRRPAMLNIGYRPTVEAVPADMTIEAHILDYTGYLYDKILQVDFIEMMRREKRFADTGKLRAQLATDFKKARRITSKIIK